MSDIWTSDKLGSLSVLLLTCFCWSEKNVWKSDKRWEPEMAECLMSMFKSHICKMLILILGTCWTTFHVHAQKLLFILGENDNGYFLTSSSIILITLSPGIRVHRAGSQLKKIIVIFNNKQRHLSIDMKKMSESQTKAGNQKKIENVKICKI